MEQTEEKGQARQAPKITRRRKWWRRSLWTIAILVVFCVAGVFASPAIVRSVLTSQLTKILHRAVSIEQVRISFSTLSVAVDGLQVKTRDGGDIEAAFKELFIDAEADSLFQGAPVLRELRLAGLRLRAVRNEDLSYSFSDLIPQPAPEPVPAQSKPTYYSLNNIQITDARIDFEDRPKQQQHAVTDLNLALPFLSNLPYQTDVYVQPAFRATVDGWPVALGGKLKPFSPDLDTALEINADDIDLVKYLQYAPVDLPVHPTSGLLALRLTLSFNRKPEQPPAVVLAGTVGLKQLAVAGTDGQTAIKLPLFEIDIKAADVLRRKIDLGRVLLQGLELPVHRAKDGAISLPGVWPIAGQKEPQPQPGATTAANDTATGALALEAAELRIADAQFSFTDETPDQPFRTVISNVQVSVQPVSFPSTKPLALTLSLQTDTGTTVRYNGTVSAQPLTAEGAIELAQLRLKDYAAYYSKLVGVGVEDGQLDLTTRFAFAPTEATPAMRLSGLTVTLSSLRIKNRGEKQDAVQLPTTTVKDVECDVAKQTLVIGEVTSSKGVIRARRNKEGTLDLVTMLAPPAAKQTPPRRVRARAPQKRQNTSKPAAPWSYTIKKVAFDRFALRIEDRAPAQPVTFVTDALTLTADTLSSDKNAKMTVALRLALPKKGMLSVSGPVRLTPLTATLKVEARDLNFVPFQPYLADSTNLLVKSGAGGARGTLALTTQGNQLAVHFTGESNVSRLHITDARTNEDLLKWQSLLISGMTLQSQPSTIDIQKVAVSGLYSRLVINPDATTNLQDMVKRAPQPPGTPSVTSVTAPTPQPTVVQAPPAATAPPTPMKVGLVTLQNSNINFSDHYVKPNYSANLTNLDGRVVGLSSEGGTLADLDLRGRFDGDAPVEIMGKLNPLAREVYVDIKASVKGIDLQPMSPYSGKYAGYAIDKGKLSFNVKYHVENRKLTAENQVFLDQLTFGKRVESPEATKLPVLLAVALLKNSRNEIDINLPISGSLDDPHFSLGKLIIQVLVNLLTRAALSPFALLGAAFGGGDNQELSYVEFEQGRRTLTAEAQTRLKTLAKALADRTALKLEITGYVDPVNDQEGLKRVQLEGKVKAQKLADLEDTGVKSGAVEEVTVNPDEYPRYLAAAYDDEKFSKPRNFVGLAKGLPVEEMEKLITTHAKVTDEDLRQLGRQRAQAVKDFLTQSGQIPAERLFLVAPANSGAAVKEGAKASRVDFSLK